MRTIAFYYLRLPALLRLIIIVVSVMLLAGITMHYLEPKDFTTLFDGFYWAIITASAIGYGDNVASTVQGKVLTILLILSGTTFLTFFFAQAAAFTINRQSRLVKGDIAYTQENHIILIGWNERTKTLIDLVHKENAKQNIVLIDRTLTKHPYLDKRIHFIKGKPYEDATLKKANARLAHSIIITANSEVSEEQSDMDSILTLVAVRGSSPKARLIVEILTPSHNENAQRAGADQIICSSKVIGAVFLENLH